MKTIAKDFNLDNLSMLKIHGKTKIELYDVNTKIKKVVEHENTFQSSVIADFLASMGENKRIVNSFDWHDIVGGIFLFDSEITSPAKYMPSGVTMVGNGAYNVANNALPNELGSYNAVESNASSSQIMMVYDFNTSQANGHIESVCLTSRIGGQIGYGNTSGRKMDVNFNTDQVGHVSIGGNSCIVNNKLYTFTLSGDTLTVAKEHRSISQGSVFRGLTSSVTIDLSSTKPTGATLSADLVVFPLNNGKIRIYSPFVTSIAPSGNVYYFDYNPSDDSVTLGTLANSSAHTLRGDNVAVTFTPDGYFVTYDTDRYLQIFNVSTGIQVIDYRTETLMDWTRLGNYDFSPSDGLFVSYASKNGFMVDLTDYTVKPMNMTASGDYAIRNLRYPSHDALMFGTDDVVSLVKNPLYLATINNLGADAVDKNATQTMKVTYTLTPA